jgi:hypothetical protein
MFRLRIAIWPLMVAIALAAVLTGIVIELKRRSEFYQTRAADHIRRINTDNSQAFSGSLLEAAEISDRRRRQNSWHWAMAKKWRQAAARPWLPVEPDPTPP